MQKKISIIKTGPLVSVPRDKDKAITHGLSSLVAIDEYFTWIHIGISGDSVAPVVQKKIKLNPKINEMAKNSIFTKIIYNPSKKK